MGSNCNMSESVSPEKWRNDCQLDIEKAQKVAENSDRFCTENDKDDRSLKTLREFLIDADNQKLHEYFRDCRELIVLLRQTYMETQDELRSTCKAQWKLEKRLDDMRKDSKVNKCSESMRTSRPKREKEFGKDYIDAELKKEGIKQNFLKSKLEELLRSTIAQVNELQQVRNMLKAVMEERQRVCDYININSTNVDFRKKLKRNKTIEEETEYKDDPSELPCYTDAADEAISASKNCRKLARNIRRRVKEEIESSVTEQKKIHKEIDRIFHLKISETRDFKAKLILQQGQNRLSLARANRALHHAKQADGYLALPVMERDITHREHPRRVMVQSYEKHYPSSVSRHENNVTGAARNHLQSNIQTTENNIKLLLQAQKQIARQLDDKTKSEQNEKKVSHYRRNKADRRWVLEPKS